jgi:hypothetical protein
MCFILENHFASKSSAVVREACNLTRKHQERQKYTDWYQNFGTYDVYATENILEENQFCLENYSRFLEANL